MKPARIHVENVIINFNHEAANADPFSQFIRTAIRSGEVDAIARSIKAKGAPTTRFEFALDGDAVIDHQTGLMWTADTVAVDQKWEVAKAAAAAVTLGGFSDWRLPEQSELLSIVDYGRHDPAINTDFFKCESSYYWSNTPYARPSGSGYAWLVNFYYGGTLVSYHDYEARVRAVRSVSSSASQ